MLIYFIEKIEDDADPHKEEYEKHISGETKTLIWVT